MHRSPTLLLFLLPAISSLGSTQSCVHKEVAAVLSDLANQLEGITEGQCGRESIDLQLNETLHKGFQNIASLITEESRRQQQSMSELKRMLRGQCPTCPGILPIQSCKEQFEDDPTSPSGYYWVQSAPDHITRVYCEMNKTCKGATLPPPTTQSPLPPSTETPRQPTIPTTPPPANGTFQNPASSCKYIPAGSPSGFYWISGSWSATLQYCDMSRSCCGSTEGWMRVADIDMTDSSQQCPLGFNLYNYNGIRSCGHGSAGTGCKSTTFSVSTVQYSKVCGRIVGYQNGTTDAFDPYINLMHGIEQNYVDGISLTHGRSPRNHIWTFAAALHEFTTIPDALCPCISHNIAFSTSNPIPSFVGQDYFCDTGDYVTTGTYRTFFSDDPLWDGQGCGTDSTCCTLNSPPWFCKQLPSSTRDDIELRLCRSARAEDAPFGVVEVYVQ